MTFQALLDKWRGFFFTPQSPVPVALFRIFFGIILLQYNSIVFGPKLLFWYGPGGIVPFETISRFYSECQPRFDLLLLFPQSDSWIVVFWILYNISVVLLTVGLFTKQSSVVVSLALISLHSHQPLNADGGSVMLRLCGIYLMFAEAGGALSVDRLIKRFTQPTLGEASCPKPSPPLGQRMIQIQVAIAYWQSSLTKLSGPMWLDGTAVYYAVRLDDIARYARSLPWLFNSIAFCKLLSWFTVVEELSLWTVVWIKRLRYYILAGGLLLHIGIDYCLQLYMFEWVMIATYINFVDARDLTRGMDHIKERVRRVFGEPAHLFYNPSLRQAMALASLIEGLDIFGRLAITKAEPEQAASCLLFAQWKQDRITGFALFSWLSAKLPVLWICYPLIGWCHRSNWCSSVTSSRSITLFNFWLASCCRCSSSMSYVTKSRLMKGFAIPLLGLLILVIGIFRSYLSVSRQSNSDATYYTLLDEDVRRLKVADQSAAGSNNQVRVQEELALALWQKQNFSEAARILEHLWKQQEEKSSQQSYDPLFVESGLNLAGLYLDWGAFKESQACYELVLKYEQSHLKSQDLRVGRDQNNLGLCHYMIAQTSESERTNELKEALNYYRQAEATFRSSLSGHAQLTANLRNQALALYDLGDGESTR